MAPGHGGPGRGGVSSLLRHFAARALRGGMRVRVTGIGTSCSPADPEPLRGTPAAPAATGPVPDASERPTRPGPNDSGVFECVQVTVLGGRAAERGLHVSLRVIVRASAFL